MRARPAVLVGDEESFRASYFGPDGRLLAALLANRPNEVAAVRRELAGAAVPLAA